MGEKKNPLLLSAAEDIADSPAAPHKTSLVSSRSSSNGVLTGTGGLPTAVFLIRIKCALQRTPPLISTFSSLVCIPGLSQYIALNWKATLRSTNGMGQMGTQCTGQARPQLQHRGDGQPAQSHPQTGPGCSASQALHGVTVAASGLQIALIYTSHCPQGISTPHVCC